VGKGVDMAVFNQRDDLRLPLLGQIVQLDLKDHDEVYSFVKRWVKLDLNVYLRYSSQNQENVERLVREAGVKMLHDIIDICTIAQRVMWDLGENNGIRWGDIQEIQRLQERIVFLPVYDSDDIRRHNDDEVIAVGEIGARMFSSTGDIFTRKVAEALSSLLTEVATTDCNPVSLCPECKNPFIMQRKPYCSYRCSHRVREREGYASLFSDGKRNPFSVRKTIKEDRF
jgi:hypothetical protein